MSALGLLTLLDDLASVLDDVALLTKVAAKKTAGVLGDDLALNAEQVAGVQPERELPVVWAVAKGSLRNKAILVPAALALSAFAPWAVIPLLMVGGAYLCFEGVEKVAHKLFHGKADSAAEQAAHAAALASPAGDRVALENDKVKGAVRTDFVLSAEIVAITLGAVAASPLVTRAAVLSAIALLMTVGVYGVVAGIVKLDDLGLHLLRRRGTSSGASAARQVGAALLKAAPYLMKGLTIAGTAAMFLVGGGILTHGIPPLHHLIEQVAGRAAGVPAVGAILRPLAAALLNAVSGAVAGALLVSAATLVKTALARRRLQRS